MKKRIIFDADLTMGVPDCDVDDGLALLYALGYAKVNPKSAEVIGLTTSYGNSNIDVVYENTVRICSELGLSIPVLKGAADKEHAHCEAAEFLVAQARAYPGELSLAVTGSTTNLKGALALDASILTAFKEIVFMGGITQTLAFNGVIMDELNFSCDSEATLRILETAKQGSALYIMTAQNCLPAYFTLSAFRERLAARSPVEGYLMSTCLPWFETMNRWYGLDGFVCWDVLTSAFILEPELFIDEEYEVVLNKRLLDAGFLEPAFAGAPTAVVHTPRIKDPLTFCERCFELWQLADLR